jgi:histidinol-phosphate aminotransferase
VTGRGLEAALAGGRPPLALVPDTGDLIRLDSNENPVGPSPAALDAIRGGFGEASRYPDDEESALRETIAAFQGVKPENVLLGCGSTELLRLAVDAFANPGSGVLTAAPSFETPLTYGTARGVPVTAVPVGADLGLDLGKMLDHGAGKGLVYVCNPNNPTGTVHGRATVEDFTTRALAAAPAARVLIDEAYFEYVDDPSYGTLIPMALADSRVLILRTFSKVHGMAGLRVGYAVARPETIAALAAFRLPISLTVLSIRAARASLGDQRSVERERARNREVRAFTRGFFERAGFKVGASETNFVMVEIRRPIEEFKKACEEGGIAVGRPFPPLTTHARISMGTMDEMKRAVKVFGKVLAV